MSPIDPKKAAAEKVINSVGLSQEKFPERYAAFFEQVDKWTEKFEDENGTPPQAEDVTATARGLLSTVWQDDGWLRGDSRKYAFEADPAKVRVPEADRSAIVRELKAKGLPVTEVAIGRRYLEIKMEAEVNLGGQ